MTMPRAYATPIARGGNLRSTDLPEAQGFEVRRNEKPSAFNSLRRSQNSGPR
jgi:hypothetical protein